MALSFAPNSEYMLCIWHYIHQLHSYSHKIISCCRLLLVDQYSSFILNDEGSGYSIFVSGYVGNNTNFMDFAVGSLATARCNAAKFSTFDLDNELNLLENCAFSHSGGWWYHSKCDTTNFNGLYSKYFNMLTRYQSIVPLKSSRIFVKQN